MLHPTKLQKFTGAEINILQMKLDNYNKFASYVETIEDYDMNKVFEGILEKEYKELEKTENEFYNKSFKRK